jgi:hypothetical protein
VQVLVYQTGKQNLRLKRIVHGEFAVAKRSLHLVKRAGG